MTSKAYAFSLEHYHRCGSFMHSGGDSDTGIALGMVLISSSTISNERVGKNDGKNAGLPHKAHSHKSGFIQSYVQSRTCYDYNNNYIGRR